MWYRPELCLAAAGCLVSQECGGMSAGRMNGDAGAGDRGLSAQPGIAASAGGADPNYFGMWCAHVDGEVKRAAPSSRTPKESRIATPADRIRTAPSAAGVVPRGRGVLVWRSFGHMVSPGCAMLICRSRTARLIRRSSNRRRRHGGGRLLIEDQYPPIAKASQCSEWDFHDRNSAGRCQHMAGTVSRMF